MKRRTPSCRGGFTVRNKVGKKATPEWSFSGDRFLAS
jgi:hypothetical protein